MMNLKNYIPIVIGFIFLMGLEGCKKIEPTFGIKDKSKISIKGANGLYLSVDGSRNNQIIADRKSIGEREKFSIQIFEDSRITLKASDFSFVGSRQDRKGLLYAGNPDSENNTFFKITAVDSGGVILQDYKNRYVSIDTNNTIKANKNNIEDADIFFLNEIPAKVFSYFSFNQLIPLFTGLILLLISLVIFQYKENKRISIILLMLGGLSVRIFTALLSTHLNLWDEQFHALVAKNMINHPFVPMLYKNPVLPFDETSWVEGHFWLHKQPLFLWQMALSMKIFGVNIFGLRLPSAIMSTIVIFFIYRIGKISINKTAGFFAALFFALSNFSLEIAAGAINTDHNDIAFLFYVSAAIWAWVEYENCDSYRKRYFLILIGLFSGCAILVKWLAGLLVFSGWGLSILLSKERRCRWVHYRNLLISLIIAGIVFLPWQIYILNAFPLISRYEFALNTRNFLEVVEGHSGNFWWHFNIAEKIYGISKYFLLFCIIVFSAALKKGIYKTAFLTFIFLIYLFYGIAATKMIAFTYCVSFLIFIALGTVMDKFFKIVILSPEYLPKKIHHIIYTTLILGVLSGFNLDIEKIQENHTIWKKDETSFFYERLNTTSVIKGLSEEINHIDEYIIFNCKRDDNIAIMFFNDVIAAYSLIPDYNTYTDLKHRGYRIAVFDNGKLPSYLMTDSDVIKIHGYWSDKKKV